MLSSTTLDHLLTWIVSSWSVKIVCFFLSPMLLQSDTALYFSLQWPPLIHHAKLYSLIIKWPQSRKSNTFEYLRSKGFFFFLIVRMGTIFKFLFIYLFIYGCVGSSSLCEGPLQLWQAGATPHRGVRASHGRGLSCCGAQAPDAQAQQLWLTGPVAPSRVGSPQTRARTRVPCIGRQTLNHCATREARKDF